VDHFSRLDRSDRKLPGPFDHSDPFSFPVSRCSIFSTSMCNMEEKTSHGSIGETPTHMCSYNKSAASCFASQVYVLAIKNNLFPERIWNVLFVIQKCCLISWNGLLKVTQYKGLITTHETVQAVSFIPPSKSSSSSNKI